MNNLTRRNYNFWDPFFVDLFEDKGNTNCSFMKTDIKDVGDHYEMKIELPEVKKEDIKLSLDDGYLTIAASFNETEEEKNKGKIIHRERHFEINGEESEVLNELQLQAVKDLGINLIDAEKLADLKEKVNPKNYMTPYNPDKVTLANELYAILTKEGLTYHEMTEVEEEAKQL